jgi:hypothetical protein
MARRELPKADAAASVTYFILVQFSDRMHRMSPLQRRQIRDTVTAAVKAEGGNCELFSTNGSSYDRMSVVTGVSAAGALRITEAIEMNGLARATTIPGLPIRK